MGPPAQSTHNSHPDISWRLLRSQTVLKNTKLTPDFEYHYFDKVETPPKKKNKKKYNHFTQKL
jgi:hypothetical protein